MESGVCLGKAGCGETIVAPAAVPSLALVSGDCAAEHVPSWNECSAGRNTPSPKTSRGEVDAWSDPRSQA